MTVISFCRLSFCQCIQGGGTLSEERCVVMFLPNLPFPAPAFINSHRWTAQIRSEPRFFLAIYRPTLNAWKHVQRACRLVRSERAGRSRVLRTKPECSLFSVRPDLRYMLLFPIRCTARARGLDLAKGTRRARVAPPCEGSDLSPSLPAPTLQLHRGNTMHVSNPTVILR